MRLIDADELIAEINKRKGAFAEGEGQEPFMAWEVEMIINDIDTIKISPLMIRDNESGGIREYGTDQHDALIISGNGGCITYEHLQCGDGSMENGMGGFSFVSVEGKTPNEYEDPDEWEAARYVNIGGIYR